ncbi:F-box/kelch-repeat protein At1g23390-like [Actinidia eriantha]|uniref:F-box/kelch-repeat protein At1g23390-like n=1 Tax=Actinidia eriantha TaxID=165200 RepID=UPI002582B64F|nr:F-box/kelch-repeat protein At1g23390-like [Actinidia eriantha]
MISASGQDDQEAPIHGDMLEAILSHVPIIDLVPASHVSTAWKRAVVSSLRHFNKPKPWLIVHSRATMHAYDPRSHVWVEIKQPSINHVSTVRSSHSNFLYALSPSKLSFSLDPLHLTWHHGDAPKIWRVDPVVAAVGRWVVVAGGTCEFEDDPLAVEIYNIESRVWSACESMPSILKDSSSSTWLSVASDDRKLFVTEKHSGVTHTFDPETRTWSRPCHLRPDPSTFYSVIAFSDGRLILIGMIGDVEIVTGIKLWRVKDCEGFECEEIGEMPLKFLEKLKNESFQFSSIGVCFAGNVVNIYNPSTAEEVVVCEFVDGCCRWWSVRNVVASDGRMVFTSSKVGIEDVRKVLRSENRRFRLYGGESRVS